MKRCSTCNRTFDDPKLSFCIEDGTPLTPVADDDDTTVVRPRNTEDDDWNAVAYQPPSGYVPPPADGPRRRRTMPWVLGIVGAFLLGILALSIAAAILIPRMMRSAREQHAASNSNRGQNTNAAPESNSNSDANENIDTPPPTDHDQVLGHLTNLEQEWMVANINADTKKLDHILADDYVAQDEKGQLQSKADYIRTIRRDTEVEKWEFSDLKVNLVGDRATVNGIFTYFSRERSVSYDFTDKFVWREGRWQATGSVTNRRGTPEVDL